MTDGRTGSGFELRLTDEAYAGWRSAAEDQGMTTAGFLEMVGRHLTAQRTPDVAEAIRRSTLPLTLTS